MLTKGPFEAPGSRHIVCLTDGGSVEEEALEREQSDRSGRFRYIVWNYQTPKARPIAYGVGEFRSVEIDGSHTRVTWTYSFMLKEDVFPGDLGALGRFLFRVGFLDRDYAAMMHGVLSGYKTTAEQHSDSVISAPAPLHDPQVSKARPGPSPHKTTAGLLLRIVFLEDMPGDVRPEFYKFRADNAFRGNRKRPV